MTYQDNTSSSSSPINFQPRKDNTYGSSSDKTRPSGDPRGRKDFKKVLQDPSLDSDDAITSIEEESEEDLAEEESTIAKNPPSLFDLTSGKVKTPSFGAQPDSGTIADAGKKTTQSPSALFSRLATSDTKKSISADSKLNAITEENDVEETEEEEEVRESTVAGTIQADDAKEKFTTRFATPQPDLSYINPMAAAGQASIDAVSAKADKAAASFATNLQELINQMVEKVQEMQTAGTTETTVTLKQPPLFAGANLILTSFDNAKGEFNISFENLKVEAKALLDMRVNQDSLKQTMDDKGFTVHIITVTTLAERPVIPASSQNQANRERDPRDRQRQNRDRG
jgi:hypothetical protein